MEIFRQIPWTSQAITLLETIQQLSRSESAIIFIRHSHRNDGQTWDQIKQLLLTPEGIEGAKIFGKLLPKRSNFRINYSRVQRCKQTAEYIAEGLRENQQNVSQLEELKILGEYLGDNTEIGKLFMRDKLQFMNYWVAGLYSPEILEPLTQYARRTAEIIWTLHRSASQGTIDIHVTHDTTIMGLEFGWSGILRDTYTDWVDFLGGFLVQLTPEKIILKIRKNQYERYYPYWYRTQ